MLKDDELYQLFVSSQARGAGVAAALMTDAEARLVDKGVKTGSRAPSATIALHASMKSADGATLANISSRSIPLKDPTV